MQRTQWLLSLLGTTTLVAATLLPVVQATTLQAAQDTLSTEERAQQKAKDPEEQLKLWLGMAANSLRAVISETKRLDKDTSAKAVSDFRTAVTSADDCVARQQHEKNYKKLLTQLHKAVKKYNFALLQALDKAAEDFRVYIQAAFEASQRVQDSAEIQLARFR